ncbi:hypothetical protein FNF31_04929 [Cafeteria roenbergensis]|uniref:Uncharacterized protein n=1 Tax=Cafeteria roenbergensis TaxID=33653 RepID=A0A5A8D1J7_CAFRO|nr:hypothetical protein FNF31_04929 [Cafeteria roenbergensis]
MDPTPRDSHGRPESPEMAAAAEAGPGVPASARQSPSPSGSEHSADVSDTASASRRRRKNRGSGGRRHRPRRARSDSQSSTPDDLAQAVVLLAESLKDRPSRDTLRAAGILLDASHGLASGKHVDASLLAVRSRVSKQLELDSLSRWLKNRPSPEKLTEANILKTTEMLGSRKAAAEAIASKISRRPSPRQVATTLHLDTPMWWSRLEPSCAQPPVPRSGAALVLAGRRLVLLGGHSPVPTGPDCSVDVLDIDSSTWTVPHIMPSSPAPACPGAIGVLPAAGLAGLPPGHNPPAVPCARYAHAAVAVSPDSVLMFGGFGAGGWLSDVWLLHTAGNPVQWTCLVEGRASYSHPLNRAGAEQAPAPAAAAAAAAPSSSSSSSAVAAAAAAPATGSAPVPTPSYDQDVVVAGEGAAPAPRAGHAAVVIGGRVVVFGGNNGGARMSDVWSFDVDTLSWRQLCAGGGADGPSARTGHSAVALECQVLRSAPRPGQGATGKEGARPGDGQPRAGEHNAPSADASGGRARRGTALERSPRMVVFGGNVGDGARTSGEIWAFDPVSCSWDRPRVAGSAPLARTGHGSAAVGSRVLVFGGGQATRVFNDLHCLNTEAWPWRWERVADMGGVPRPRVAHAVAAVGSAMVVFGGTNHDSDAFGDLYSLDASDIGLWTDGGAREEDDAESDCAESDAPVAASSEELRRRCSAPALPTNARRSTLAMSPASPSHSRFAASRFAPANAVSPGSAGASRGAAAAASAAAAEAASPSPPRLLPEGVAEAADAAYGAAAKALSAGIAAGSSVASEAERLASDAGSQESLRAALEALEREEEERFGALRRDLEAAREASIGRIRALKLACAGGASAE